MSRTGTTLTAAAAAVLLASCSSSTTDDPATTAAPSSSSSSPSSSAADGALPTSYTIPGAGVFPEGVTSDGDSFWVTSTSDGAVFRGTAGDAAMSVLAPGGAEGRTAAAGIEVSDDGSTLLVAGGSTGQVSVLDAETGDTLRTFSNGLGPDATFLNDIAVGDDGAAYVTDSRNPVLYRIPADAIGEAGEDGTLEEAVSFEGTPFTYDDGFNANGIVITDDGRYAVVVQSSTGNLYRVDLESSEVTQVDLGGETLTSGDGMELTEDGPLYVVRNSLETVAVVDLADDAASGTVTGQPEYPDLMYPTTAAVVGDRLLLVNSQFDQRGGQPVEPFTVGAIDLP